MYRKVVINSTILLCACVTSYFFYKKIPTVLAYKNNYVANKYISNKITTFINSELENYIITLNFGDACWEIDRDFILKNTKKIGNFETIMIASDIDSKCCYISIAKSKNELTIRSDA